MSSNNNFSLLVLFSLLLLLILDSADLTFARSCQRKCGGIHIPYPFGIETGCYLEKWYAIECTSSSGKFIPLLSSISKEVVSISLPEPFDSQEILNVALAGSVRIRNSITSKGCSNDGKELGSLLNLTGTPFYVSSNNTLTAIGCDNTASLTNVEPSMVGCKTSCKKEHNTPIKDYLSLARCKDYGYNDCNETSFLNENDCNGFGCCQANMPSKLQQIVGVNINDSTKTKGGCKVAFLTNEVYSLSNGSNPERHYAKQNATLELGWYIYTRNLSFIDSLGCKNMEENINHISDFLSAERINDNISCACHYFSYNSSYARCRCNMGYRGNPYTPGGCKDIKECQIAKDDYDCGTRGTCVNLQGSFKCVYIKNRQIVAIGIGSSLGSLVFIGGIYWLYRFIRKQMRLNQKRKFFKRNGGLLLKQHLTSTENKVEKTIVFSSRELKKATGNFSLDRILGQGGQGTVYKGMLVDGRIVAVKKSKLVDEDKLEEFINEVVILSQLNHRNIVKLLGCCLETNVPLLVYEFIPNGNLFELLHDEYDNCTMTTWEVRLRIAVDVAGALSYLHSAASCPIYHRDVKSTNIMLDEKYHAKVSDFGTSRTVTVDHTHLTTVVSGTVGYMDPEYFQSSQFTDKSDVYSFGVVLVELITGEKCVSVLRSEENRALSTYFILAMKEDRLFDVIDARIRDGCKLDQVTAVAKIAKRCLNLKGKKRPSMREVSMELEKIHSSLGDMKPPEYVSENEEEMEEGVVEVNIEIESMNNVAVTASTSQHNIATSSLSWSEEEPLFPFQTR